MNISRLALIHGNVLTMDQKRPKAEAVLVQDDKIIAVGSDNQIISQIDTSTEVIDLHGRTLLPGFIDCHCHPMYFGLAQNEVDCTTPPEGSIRDIIERIREAANEKQEGKWIIGRGYDDFSLKEKRHPNRWDLDAASPKNPVLITRSCAHIAAVNSIALKLANITKNTENPKGGQIDKDPMTGEPTGVLRERAIDIVLRIVPSPTEEELRQAINRASWDFVSRGVTSVTDAGIGLAAEARAYQEAVQKDGMPLRVNIMYSIDLFPQLEALGISTGFGDERLKVGGIKIVLDGSMTGRTAAVSHPYRDDPKNTGIMYFSQDELDKLVLKAHKAGFQIGIHAIGDRAIDSALDAFESALQSVPVDDHRHRIEHCGICNPGIISRLKNLRVIPVPQPLFLYGSGESYRAGLGDEGTAWAYPLGSFLREDIPVPMSSDSLGLMDPLLGIYTAVTRKTFEGKDVGPIQRISIEEALRAYTINSAYADFDENIKGSVEIGKVADFVVLSDDPCAVDSEIIKDLKVELTIVGGKIVYSKEAIKG